MIGDIQAFPNTIQQARGVCAFLTGRKTTRAVQQLTGISHRTVHRLLGRLVGLGLAERVEFWHRRGRCCYWFARPAGGWQRVIERTFGILVRQGPGWMETRSRKVGRSEWAWLYATACRSNEKSTRFTGLPTITIIKKSAVEGTAAAGCGDLCRGSVREERRERVRLGEDHSGGYLRDGAALHPAGR